MCLNNYNIDGTREKNALNIVKQSEKLMEVEERAGSSGMIGS